LELRPRCSRAGGGSIGQAGLYSSSAYASVPCPPRARDLTNGISLRAPAGGRISRRPVLASEFSEQPRAGVAPQHWAAL